MTPDQFQVTRFVNDAFDDRTPWDDGYHHPDNSIVGFLWGLVTVFGAFFMAILAFGLLFREIW